MKKPASSNKLGSDAETRPPAQPQAAPAPVLASDQVGKNPAAVQLGRLGGLKGGPARARKLTQQQRSDIARKAAQARWANRRQQ